MAVTELSISARGVLRLGDKVKVDLSVELVERVDEVLGLFEFGSREEFVEAAVRRLLDRCKVLAGRSR